MSAAELRELLSKISSKDLEGLSEPRRALIKWLRNEVFKVGS